MKDDVLGGDRMLRNVQKRGMMIPLLLAIPRLKCTLNKFNIYVIPTYRGRGENLFFCLLFSCYPCATQEDDEERRVVIH